MTIDQLNTKYKDQIVAIIDQKTKPLGALGQLEALAMQLALIQSNRQNALARKLSISKPTALVFAGDHGISEEGISIAPSDVTRQMVLNFINGGAAINCFCRANNIDLKVIDAGIIEPIDEQIKLQNPQFIEQRLGRGTDNFSKTAAMSEQQVELGLEYGKKIALAQINDGCELLILGEMGISNTSSATAILAAISNAPVAECVGKGTGINDQQLQHKTKLITDAVARLENQQPMDLMRELGGFEIVQMVGAILAAAEQKVAVLIDGFIVGSAALLATKLNPNIGQYLIFAHQSNESGHQLMLAQLAATPLLKLELRLGEGTGAALALPLLVAATHFYNDMASFEQAGVTV
ncbi:nicotinate-nucleotide--dimethylbenzimidazole phosphoribosyltransferase [Thalassotalea crassostreae]|uniref:nicotinate-nucleotide--dimethylbenzimidazole phosphoribosyltransferase n=1 Tax=Thalassotalea crassostreae TaxID=1763536 RepID=UPI000838C446|nr:nicotinate-nucleotide--dimethylbenzimidazole phosphoribosyltransferase [Thalassotalea crassostreae]